MPLDLKGMEALLRQFHRFVAPLAARMYGISLESPIQPQISSASQEHCSIVKVLFSISNYPYFASYKGLVPTDVESTVAVAQLNFEVRSLGSDN